MRFDYSEIARITLELLDEFGGDFWFGKRSSPNSQIIAKHKIIALADDVDFAYTQSKDYKTTTKKYLVAANEFERTGLVPTVGDLLSSKSSEKDLSGAITHVKEVNPSGAKVIIYEIYTSS